jgi:chromosome segregation ATPase
VLRERETHIALLEDELRRKDQWLEDAKRDLADLDRKHQDLTAELEKSNHWAGRLNSELAASGARVQQLQEELVAAQAEAQAKIDELEARARAELEAKLLELSQCVEYLHQAEKTVEERTHWAQRLDAELGDLRRKLALVESSRWVRLGRRVGMGPDADPR